jgi:hypothetical protein
VKASLWRGGAALTLLVLLGWWQQVEFVDAMLGPWHATLEWLEPDFKVVELRAHATASESLIELVVTPARVILVNGRAIVPEGNEMAAASMSRGTAWLSLSLFLVALAAWPIARPSAEWPMRVAIGAPLLAMLLLLDVPITLLGPLRAMVAGGSNADFEPWIVGSRFLRGGGRFLLAFGLAAAACLIAQSFATRRNSA